jgi:hypothetical protein
MKKIILLSLTLFSLTALASEVEYRRPVQGPEAGYDYDGNAPRDGYMSCFVSADREHVKCAGVDYVPAKLLQEREPSSVPKKK